MDVGILGGTFDPIHNGHLIVADEVRTRLELDKVFFVPAGQPWLKGDKNISPAIHRVEMVRLAISPNPRFKLSALEVERPGPSYSVDTIDALRDQLGSEVGLFFLLGSDILSELPQWKGPSRLIQMCRLVAYSRPGYTSPPLRSLESAIPGISSRILPLEVPQIDISSTQIRTLVAQGHSIRSLVPEAVERYIQEQGLYL
jgi:nicotinate-nucleotide adenylyltransferase